MFMDLFAQVRKIEKGFDGHPGPGFTTVRGYGVVPFNYFLRHGRWDHNFPISANEVMALNVFHFKVGLGEQFLGRCVC